MSVSYIFTNSVRIGNNTISYSVTKTSDGEYVYDGSLAANQTDALVAAAIDVSQIVGLYMYSDADLTIQTNSGSSPADTINLDGGTPLVWIKDQGTTCPLTTDVTALYLTNTTACSVIKFRILVDLTV